MKDGLLFILETIQGFRKRPKKYKHYVKVPKQLYDELVESNVIIPEDLWAEEAAYFEVDDFSVTISFTTYWHVEDVHIKILDYLVRKNMNGVSSVERGGNMF